MKNISARYLFLPLLLFTICTKCSGSQKGPPKKGRAELTINIPYISEDVPEDEAYWKETMKELKTKMEKGGAKGVIITIDGKEFGDNVEFKDACPNTGDFKIEILTKAEKKRRENEKTAQDALTALKKSSKSARNWGVLYGSLITTSIGSAIFYAMYQKNIRKGKEEGKNKSKNKT